ncbi:MAG TPA: carboxypeptidase-like regulatory domain-containing protein, partial [Acidobacteriota bacterium]|nr:carboxypeptidase-like regulatory domain-containing protein [Acidobacteriota bacterium]
MAFGILSWGLPFRMATLIIALIFASALPNLCHAQVLYGSMVGNVKDETGGAIPGADVTIINNDTNLTRHGVTNEVGLYNFPTVPSGTYTLRVSMPGFRDYVKANIVVTVNSTTRADAVLSVGEVTDEVVVTSEATELLQTDRAEVHHEVTRKQIENLPVPVGRNYQNLFETIPGFEMVGSSRGGRMGGCNPSQSRHFNVNGTTRSTTSTNIDGAPTAHIWNV